MNKTRVGSEMTKDEYGTTHLSALRHFMTKTTTVAAPTCYTVVQITDSGFWIG